MVSYFVFLCLILCSVPCILPQTSVTATEVKKPPAARAVNLTYYLFENRGGPGSNRDVLPAAGTGTNGTGALGWGSFFVFDHKLRDAPTENGKLLGKSTGTAVVTNIGGIEGGGFLLYCNHIFGNESVYYKSSITVTGQVDFTNPPTIDECTVPGGTGHFRGWRGYGLVERVSQVGGLTVYKWRLSLSKDPVLGDQSK